MSSVQEAFIFLARTLFDLYIMIVLLRFLLQVAKADFYNPVSQFVVKATSPLLNPLRKIIPGVGGLDVASLVLALIICMTKIAAISLIASGTFVDPVRWIPVSLLWLVYEVLNIYFFSILLSAILSWFPAAHQHPITRLIWQLVEPVLAPIRKLIPPMGGFDLSVIFALIGLQFLQILLRGLLG